ncbi:MAG: DUF4175 family protein [Longimicrobiales bacterium]
MSPAPSLSRLIDAARRAVRRDTAIAVLATAAAVLPVVLVFAWLFGGAGAWLAPSPAPLILELLAVAAVGGVVFYAMRRWLRGLDEPDLAAESERRLGLPAGAVRGILELGRNIPVGTSPALFRREQTEITRRFAGDSPRLVSGDIGRRVRRRKLIAVAGLVGLSLVAGLLGFVSPARTQAGWRPLLHPVAHLSSPPLPALVVRPGDSEVLRGGDIEVVVLAPGREAVVVLSRADGDVLRRQTVQVSGDSAVGSIARIDARTTYWIEAPDGARSDTYTITPLDPLLLSELSVEVVYPSYVGRAPERFETEVPPLEVPEGTQLVVRGRATRPLREAALHSDGDGTRIPFTVEDAAFSGRWTPAASGAYDWWLLGGDGTALAAGPAPIEITVVPDAPPQVEITFPGTDTILDPEMVQAIAGDARDDYRLAKAELVSWRVSSSGAAEPAIETPVALQGVDERALVRAVLDATERNLLAGDTLKYFLRVTDSSPRQQTGVSRTYSLWLPSMAELRKQTGRDASELIERAEDLVSTAEQVQSETRDLQRRTAASNSRQQQVAASGSGSPGGNRRSMDFQESEQARQVLEQQERLSAELEQIRQSVQALEKAMAAAGLRDQDLQQRLQELRELYDKILTPELREKLDELRSALEKLDPEQVEQALEQLTAQQEQLQDQLEKSLELLRRAAAEQQMNLLAQEARELATQQEALAEAMRQDRQATPQQAATQEQLERAAEQLAGTMQQLQQQLDAQGEQEASEQAASATQGTREAQQAMQQASQQAQRQQGEQAAESGRAAAQKMTEAAETLEGARQAMAEKWKQEVQESVQQATNEALSLAQRQQALLDQMKQQSDPTAQPKPLSQPLQPPRTGQQSGQQQAGQQQSGQQAGQQKGGQQQSGQKQSGQKQGGQQAGQQKGGQQRGGQQGGSQQIGQGGSLEGMRAEQAALQQGLEQLGKNLAEAGERTALMNREVGSALGRANLSMQETMRGLQQTGSQQGMPTSQASQTVEALNRLALALLNNAQQVEQSQNGTGMQQAMQELAELAKQQGALNGQGNSLMPLNLSSRAMSQQLERMARDQREIASRLEGVNEMMGGREDVLGRLDALASEAEQIARQLEGGRLPPEVLARQERLFHRLLDAGRTLERDETSDERVGEAPGAFDPSRAEALDPGLLDDGMRYRVPTPEELRDLPPAYRRLILEYFERLNRPAAAGEPGQPRR